MTTTLGDSALVALVVRTVEVATFGLTKVESEQSAGLALMPCERLLSSDTRMSASTAPTCAFTSALPAKARCATNPRVIDVRSWANASGSVSASKVPAACHRVTASENRRRSPAYEAPGRLELGVALGVTPAVEGDEEAVDVALAVTAETGDGAENLLEELREGRRLWIRQDRARSSAIAAVPSVTTALMIWSLPLKYP